MYLKLGHAPLVFGLNDCVWLEKVHFTAETAHQQRNRGNLFLSNRDEFINSVANNDVAATDGVKVQIEI